MKVLHLVSGNLSDVAARGAYWLHESLRESVVDSYLLTNSREIFFADRVGTLASTTPLKLKFMMLPRLAGLPK